MAKLPSQNQLLEMFEYLPLTGALIRRSNGNEIKPYRRNGKIARRVVMITIDGDSTLHQATRVIWKMVTGEDPPSCIDHINRDPCDDRWENLREATVSQNCANMVRPKRDLPPNVYRRSGDYNFEKPYFVGVRKNWKFIQRGYFYTPEEAEAVAKRLKEELHGEFTPNP